MWRGPALVVLCGCAPAFAGPSGAHDRKVRAIERRPERSGEKLARALAELREARAVYEKDGDRAHATWAEAVRALLLARSGDHASALVIARALDTEHAPKETRALVQRALFHGLAGAGDVEESARAAVRLNEILHAELPEARRRYARAPELDEACDRLEAESGAGGCARLERSLTGFVTLRDFSRWKRKRALTSVDLDRVHSRGLPILEDCVREVAKKDLEFYAGASLELSWTVDRQGRPVEIEVRPGRYARDLEPCTNGVIRWLRYPKVWTRERKTIAIPLQIGGRPQ